MNRPLVQQALREHLPRHHERPKDEGTLRKAPLLRTPKNPPSRPRRATVREPWVTGAPGRVCQASSLKKHTLISKLLRFDVAWTVDLSCRTTVMSLNMSPRHVTRGTCARTWLSTGLHLCWAHSAGGDVLVPEPQPDHPVATPSAREPCRAHGRHQGRLTA